MQSVVVAMLKEGESVNHSFRFVLRTDFPLYSTKTPVTLHSVTSDCKAQAKRERDSPRVCVCHRSYPLALTRVFLGERACARGEGEKGFGVSSCRWLLLTSGFAGPETVDCGRARWLPDRPTPGNGGVVKARAADLVPGLPWTFWLRRKQQGRMQPRRIRPRRRSPRRRQPRRRRPRQL
jgi:hypothetical protein